MRGTGPVTIDGATVYAYFTVTGPDTRLRLSADECERLDLFPGKPATVGLPGRPPARVLLTAAMSALPFVWVEGRATTRLAAPPV